MLQALCARPCHRPLHRIDFARLVLSCFKRTIKRLWERKRQVTSLATLHRIRIIHVRGHRYIEVLSAAEAVQRCVNDDDLWIGIRRRRATMQQHVPLSISYGGSQQHRGVCPTVVWQTPSPTEHDPNISVGVPSFIDSADRARDSTKWFEPILN